MKPVILTIFLMLFVTYAAFGQSEKNDLKLSISGLPLYGSSGSFGSGFNGLVLKPALGYFISDKTTIDLNFSYASLKKLTVGGADSYYNSYALVPSIRNNFMNKEKIRIFAEIGYGFGTIRYEADESSSRNSQHDDLSGGISIFNIGIGGNYFFNEKFGLEFILPYLSTKNITSDNSRNLYSGIGPTIGVTYRLN